MLMIGERLRTIRESKNLSQGDIEQRTGMIRCYTSRVENGHTVPSIETLAKYAQALDIPLYQIFYDGEEAPKKIKGGELDGEKLSLSERREIERLGRQFKTTYGPKGQRLTRWPPQASQPATAQSLCLALSASCEASTEDLQPFAHVLSEWTITLPLSL
jgi:transcriptional regulator with XRE-family HTH domain